MVCHFVQFRSQHLKKEVALPLLKNSQVEPAEKEVALPLLKNSQVEPNQNYNEYKNCKPYNFTLINLRTPHGRRTTRPAGSQKLKKQNS